MDTKEDGRESPKHPFFIHSIFVVLHADKFPSVVDYRDARAFMSHCYWTIFNSLFPHPSKPLTSLPVDFH